MQTLKLILAAHPFLAGLEPRYIELLAGCATNRRFHAGTYLLREGDDANTFYVLREGRVALETNTGAPGVVTVETIEAGEVLGWSWLFPPYKWHFSARAVTPVRALAFDAVCLRGKCETDPALGYELMKRFAAVIVERLQATRLQLLDVYASVPTRGHA